MPVDFDYLGHPNQTYGAVEYVYTQGKAKGVKVLHVKNGSGLELEILEDRCMDVSRLSFKGMNLSYLSKCGIVGPEYYNPDGFEFLQSFNVGFLTTCGLRHIGAPCSIGNESFGLHGRIANTPAEQVCAFVEHENEKDKAVIRVSGLVREARIFRENLALYRSFEIPVGRNHFIIHNRIHNYGFTPQSIMLMLHMNFGYPLLDEHAQLYLPTVGTEPRDARAKEGLDHFTRIEAPATTFDEQVYFHTLHTHEDSQTAVALINPTLGFGVALRYRTSQFPFTTQWNQFAKGDYVLGIEPAACKMVGRKEALERQLAPVISPQDYKDFDVQVELIDGPQAIDACIQEIQKLQQ